jgi:hypothetical protein
LTSIEEKLGFVGREPTTSSSAPLLRTVKSGVSSELFTGVDGELCVDVGCEYVSLVVLEFELFVVEPRGVK